MIEDLVAAVLGGIVSPKDRPMSKRRFIAVWIVAPWLLIAVGVGVVLALT